jgi:hypothetical protein
MDNKIKKFKCMDCEEMKGHIIWKGSCDNKYRCELCWKKYDTKLINEIMIKLMELKLKSK